MNISRKFNPKLIATFSALAMLLIVTHHAIGNYNNKKFFCNSLTASQDTVPAPRNAKTNITRPSSTDTTRKPPAARDSANRSDTIPGSKTDTLNIKISKDTLDAPIDYTASDSVVLE